MIKCDECGKPTDNFKIYSNEKGESKYYCPKCWTLKFKRKACKDCGKEMFIEDRAGTLFFVCKDCGRMEKFIGSLQCRKEVRISKSS